MDNNSRALKSGIWYTASNFLVKSIGFITTPIFTRMLSKQEFGLYNNYISWLAIFTIIISLNIDSTLISAKYDYEDKFDEYILSSLSLSTLSVLVWLIIFGFFSDAFVEWLNMELKYIFAMLLYLLFLPSIHFFQSRERFNFEYKKSVAASIILSLGTASLSVILVKNLDNRLDGRILGAVLPTVLLGFGFYVFFIIKGKRIKISCWKYALPICIPYIPHLLSLSLLNSMDRVMITRWCGAEETAIYSLAYTCGSLVTLLMTSMNSAFAPWLGEKLAENRNDEISRFSKVYIGAFFVLAVGIMAVAPEVLLILGGQSYSEAKYVMTPIAMGCICQFLYTLFVNVEQFRKKTIGMAIASVIAASINYGLNVLLIPRVGYLAAAYTTLVGYLCLLLIHMFLVFRMGCKSVYDYKLIFFTVVVGIGIMIGMNFLYEINVVRYLFVGTYAIAIITTALRYKERILTVIRRRS